MEGPGRGQATWAQEESCAVLPVPKDLGIEQNMKISRDTTGKGRDGGSRMRVRGMSARGCQPRGSRAYHVSFVAALVLVHSVFMVFGTGPWTVGATKEAGRRRSSSRAVSVSMHAPWPTLPLSPALETSEYFAEASQASFWEFSRRITEALSKIHGKVDGSGNSNAHLTGDTVLAHSLIVSRGMAPPLFHKVLEVSLDTRAFAPAVEAQHQVSLAALEQVEGRCSEQFANGDAWAVISWPGVPVEANGHPVPVCVASGLESALEHAKPVQRLPSSASASATDESRRVTTSISRHDHVFPASVPVEMGAPTVFLYGLIGTQSFLSFHNLLEGLVAKGSVTYVYRHAPSPSSSENASLRTYLRGFGVTLDLKSMEYKALDDRALGGDEDEDEDDNDESKYLDEASTSSAAEIPEEEEIFGIFFKRLLQRHPNLDDPLRSFRETLMVEQKEGVGSNPGDMKVWDMKDLGLQAAQIICNAKDPLKHLGEISQNFPLYARRLIGVPVKEKLRRQAGSVSRVMEGARSGAGSNSVLFNGLSIDAASDGFNIFELLTKILGEASTQARFAHLGLPSNVMSKVKEAAENPGPRFGSELNAMIGLRVDTRSGSKGRIYYLNNLEKDKAYKRWPKQVANLMQPAYQLFAVRKNLYTGVFVLDPTTKVGLHAIRSMFRIKDMNIPLRFGLAMVPSDVHARTAEDTESANADHVKVADIVRLLAAAKKKSGTGAANLFLAELSKIESFPIKREVAIAAFASAMKSETGTWSGSGHVELAESTLQSNEYMKVPGKVEEYVRAKGLSVNSYAINGKVYDSVGSLEQDLMQVIFAEQQRVQQLVQRGLIRDKTNAYAFFTGTSKKKTKKTSFSSEFAFSHYDSRILGEDSDSEFLPLVSAGGTEENKDVENSAAKPHSLLLDAFRQSEVPYFTSRDIEETAETAEEENVEKSSKDRKGSLVPVTHWVVADLCTEYGLSVAAAAVERLDGSEGAVRVALFHRGEQKTTADGACLKSDAVNGALGPKVTEILTSNSKSPAFFISALSSVLPRDAKGPVVVTNGRLIRLGVSSYDPSNLPFSRDSFLLVEKYESIRIVNKLHRTLRRASSSYKSATSVGDVANDDEAVNQGSGVMSPHEMIMRINSLVSQQSKSSRRKPAIKPEKAKKRFDAISFSSEGTREDMQVVAVVDPLSVAAQRITPTLLMLRDVFNMSVTVVLNPATDITEFPLKNFYRFVPTRVTGSQNGDSIVDIIGQRSDESNPKSEDKENAASWGSKEASLTKFRRLPKQHILTLKLITPEAWVAMKYKVEDDLDNIRLDDTTMGARRQVNAEFRLNSLLIAGSCNDLTHHKPPNGLQLVLKFMNGEDSTRSTDTLVMQNLGYFQLQAQPGVWTLQLDEGRASELYALAPTGKFLLIAPFCQYANVLSMRYCRRKEYSTSHHNTTQHNTTQHNTTPTCVALIRKSFATCWITVFSYSVIVPTTM